MNRRTLGLLCVLTLCIVLASSCVSVMQAGYRRMVEVVLVPADGAVADEAAWEVAKTVVNARLDAKEHKTFGVYADTENNRMEVEFDWSGFSDSDEIQAYAEDLINRVELGFYIGSETKPATDKDGNDVQVPAGELILTGADVASAHAGIHPETMEPILQIELNESGRQVFEEATKKQAKVHGTISIWLDGEMVSDPEVFAPITEGEMIIDGLESTEEAMTIANGLQGGMLPFDLEVERCTWQE